MLGITLRHAKHVTGAYTDEFVNRLWSGVSQSIWRGKCALYIGILRSTERRWKLCQ